MQFIKVFHSIKQFLLANLFLLLFSAQNALASTEHYFDLYSEALWLNRTKTVASLTQARGGWKNSEQGWESYLGLRMGSDSRTLLSKNDSIYNDNYFFPHIGIDWTRVPGLRLQAQLGYSFDLKKAVNKAGFDMRTGAILYLENHPKPFLLEHYGESLYTHRYRNWITAYQARLLLPINRLPLSPMVTGVAQTDSAGLAYNRFIELRLGTRLQYQPESNLSLRLEPHYAFARRKQDNHTYLNYGEFRTLLVVGASF